MIAHAIWTVAVVFQSVVAGHHHRHSLELVSVDALVIEIVVVIAHSVHFRLVLFLSHQQVEEMGAILVVVQGESGGPGALEVCQED